jgi:hypothetical protein
MGLLFLSVFVSAGLGLYYVISKKGDVNDRMEKNYYHRRFSKNKIQAELHIEQLNALIKTGNYEGDFLNKDATAQNYLNQLKANLETNYSEAVFKKIKKTKLKHKEKTAYAKLLKEESERFYLVERDLAKLQSKYMI